jgi:hypothetical protein
MLFRRQITNYQGVNEDEDSLDIRHRAFGGVVNHSHGSISAEFGHREQHAPLCGNGEKSWPGKCG